MALARLLSGGGLLPNQVGIDYAWSSAASVEPIPEGRNFYPRILGDIGRAQSSVHILMFGWKTGSVGLRIRDALLECLGRNVEVRVLVDSFGSRPHSSSKDLYQSLAAAGAKIVVNDLLPPHRFGRYPDREVGRRYREIGRADHRKLLLIDGSVMWTGGAGFEDHFEDGGFHDVMVRVTGSIVRQAQAVFLSSFSANGGELPRNVSQFFAPANAESVPAALVQVVPGGFASASQAIEELILGAEQRLDIMNPYLTDPTMIDAIVAAAQRGCTVRVVVSKKSNNTLASAALRHHYPRLLKAGVKLFEYPGTVVHAKLVVADDRVCFGTVNLDAWALRRNFEIALIVDDARVSQTFVDDIFNPDIEQCLPGHPVEAAVGRALGSVASRFAYFL